MRPFEGLRVIDTTHVLAGPFATYQLAVLGADVVKIERPGDPDQTRGQGPDPELRRTGMATTYLAQASNKRCLTLNLKTDQGVGILRRLISDADVFVENYRPGAFDELGLSYEALASINQRLVYCSISAFGQIGPRSSQTAYDMVVQATSGLMAMTGTRTVNPIRIGAPVIDYATGTSAALAISSALYQRERSGRGQRIDVSMFDVATILMGAQVTAFSYGGHEPQPTGNRHAVATIGCYETKDGQIMIAAANPRQQARLWKLLGRPELIRNNEGERLAHAAQATSVLEQVFLERSAAEWEDYLQAHGVPAGRVRTMVEALDDRQRGARQALHQHDGCDGVARPFTVPVAAFQFQHDGPRIDHAPRRVGADTDAVLTQLGFDPAAIAGLRENGVV